MIDDKTKSKPSRNGYKKTNPKRKPQKSPSRTKSFPDRMIPTTDSALSIISKYKSTNLGIKLIVRHFVAKDDNLGDLSALENQIRLAINRFSLEHGYVSTVTVANVTTYITALWQVVAGALVLQRTQNLLELEDVYGENVADAFYTLDTTGEAPETLYASPFGTGATARFNDSITNHAYDTDFLAPMGSVYCSEHMLKTMVGLFSVVHTSKFDRDENVFDVYWPEVANYSGLKTLISTVLGYHATYPDLTSILSLLGLKPLKQMGLDLRRDRLQQSLLVRRDPLSEIMLANSKVKFEYKTDTEAADSEGFFSEITTTEFIDLYDTTSLIPESSDGKISTLNSIDKYAFMQAKYLYDDIVFMNANMLVYYDSAGTRTRALQSIIPWTLLAASLDSAAINTGGGAGTGIANDTFINYLSITSRFAMDLLPPTLQYPKLAMKKGINSISSTPEIIIDSSVFTANTSAMYGEGLRPSIYTVDNGAYYETLSLIWLVFGITDTNRFVIG